jgi:outer membrane protein OmpA-like peptidoglycan-associated protein
LAVQIVVHDAVAQSGGDERAKAAAAAVVKGGAKADRLATVMAGTRTPVVDPSDLRNRGRNARLELVFLTAN